MVVDANKTINCILFPCKPNKIAQKGDKKTSQMWFSNIERTNRNPSAVSSLDWQSLFLCLDDNACKITWPYVGTYIAMSRFPSEIF